MGTELAVRNTAVPSLLRPSAQFVGRHPASWSWKTLTKLPSMMKTQVRQTEKPVARRLAFCAADYEAAAGQGAETSVRTKAMTTGFRTSCGGRRLQPNCCRGQRESARHCDRPLATEKQLQTAVETIESQAMVCRSILGGYSRRSLSTCQRRYDGVRVQGTSPR